MNYSTFPNENETEERDVLMFYLEGVAMPVVSVFGILGNLVCIVTLSTNRSRLDLHPSFTNLLICLAVFDLLFLVFANMVYPPREIFSFPQSKFQLHVYLAPYLAPLINIALTGSVYTVMAIAIERYTTTTNSCFMAGKEKDRLMIVFIVLFSVLYNIVKFFEYQVEEYPAKLPEHSENLTQTQDVGVFVNATWLRRHPVYSLNYIVVGNFIVMNLIPVTVLATLNTLIYRNVARSNSVHNRLSSKHRQDSTMAALLSSIVVVFFVCHSTKIVTNVYEAVQMYQYGTMIQWSSWASIIARWNHLMLATNSSINIIIYVAKDFKFRQALCAMMNSCCSCCINKLASRYSSTDMTNLHVLPSSNLKTKMGREEREFSVC